MMIMTIRHRALVNGKINEDVLFVVVCFKSYNIYSKDIVSSIKGDFYSFILI